MLRLDYLSCLLTVASTVLIGRRKWQGWIVAAANSVIIGVIGWRTAQIGFVPANLFCIGIYAYNILLWRRPLQNEASPSTPVSDRLVAHVSAHVPRRFSRRPVHPPAADERNSRSDRVRTRTLPHQR